MNETLIRQLNEAKGKQTVYFKNRELIVNQNDLIIYKIVKNFINRSEYIHQLNKENQYLFLMKSWYYILYQIECEKRVIEEEDVEMYEDFYQAFLEETNQLSFNEKNDLLYRFPWHLRTWAIDQNDRTALNFTFIENVSTLDNLSSIKMPDVSYFMLLDFDKWAIFTLEDDIQEGHLEKANYQLQENLSSMIYYTENFEQVISKELTYEEKDKHGLNIIAFLLAKIYEKNEIKTTFYEFCMCTLFYMCFWHMEASNVKSNWYLKEGKFNFFKRHKKEMIGM